MDWISRRCIACVFIKWTFVFAQGSASTAIQPSRRPVSTGCLTGCSSFAQSKLSFAGADVSRLAKTKSERPALLPQRNELEVVRNFPAERLRLRDRLRKQSGGMRKTGAHGRRDAERFLFRAHCARDVTRFKVNRTVLIVRFRVPGISTNHVR